MQKRFIFADIKQKIDHKNVLIVTGMRQVGKTTLLRQVFDYIGDRPKLWFDLDNPLDQKIFEDIDYKNIYKRLLSMVNTGDKERLFVFVDEIQNFPEITKVIKYLLDHYGVKFIVTGSSNYYLKNLFPESLSGRKFLYTLPPLSFQEILYFKGVINNAPQVGSLSEIIQSKDLVSFKEREVLYEDYLLFGGFPEVVMTDDRDLKKEILKNIFASFFEKDLRILSDHKDIRELRDLILLLAPRVGSLLDVSKIAGELGIDRPKLYAYLEFLQGVFFVHLLPKYSKSIDRSVAGGRKLYFSDNGILNILGRLNDGQIFENAAIAQLLNYGDLRFYNKKNAEEVDVILEDNAWEIKNNPSRQDVVKLDKIVKKLSLESGNFITKKYSDYQNALPASFI